MADKVIYQSPGFVIALSNVAVAAVPYDAETRPDGSVIPGFIDLRGRADLIDQVVEARESPGLRGLLTVLNGKSSPFMSIGCEKGVFPTETEDADKPTCYVGASLDIVFRDIQRNQDPDQFVLLAKAIVNNAGIDAEQSYSFEFIIEPLRHYFDHQDCFTLNLKLQGYGMAEDAAAAAFERAALTAENALKELTRASFFSFLSRSG